MSKKVTKITGKVNSMEYVAKNGFPEVGMFEDMKGLQKFYKQLETPMLEEWCALEGLEYKPSDNEPIHRMRVCMAILYKHFPKDKAESTKKKSKYADYSTEDLIQMAIDNNVAFETTEDMRIMRMRAIMALRVAKLID